MRSLNDVIDPSGIGTAGSGMLDKSQDAVDLFNRGFSCSQAVLSTYGEDFGLDRGTAMRIAGAFGGGMDQRGETCGAVTGALMIIGLKHGSLGPEDPESKERTYDLSRDFIRSFEEMNGSIMCRDLLGYDLAIPDEKRIIREKGLTKTLCPGFVKDAAEILEELLK
ncbi:MAG: C-GCAxxG-C-C family protein [Thermoplasmatota archaeon]